MDILNHLPQDFSFEVPVQTKAVLHLENPIASRAQSNHLRRILVIFIIIALIGFVAFLAYKYALGNRKDSRFCAVA